MDPPPLALERNGDAPGASPDSPLLDLLAMLDFAIQKEPINWR